MSGTAVNRERYTESTRFGRLPATVSIPIREPGSALTHFAGLILMAIGAGPLIMRASIYGSVRTVIGVIVFVLTSCMLYAASTAYHTVVLDLKHTTLFRKLDHVSISVMIAGTYTPICLTWLYDSVGRWLLAAIWALAVGGVILKLAWITCPKWLSSGIYILMGWLCLFALGPLLSALPAGAFGWLLAGGLFYSAGAVIYALHPKKFDAKHIYFGSHEIFHVLIMLGTFCHYMVMFHYTAFIA